MNAETKPAHPIVDMRSRPSFLHAFFGGAPGTPEFDVVKWLNKRVGAKEIGHFERATDPAGFLAEMDDAAISVAVMVARSVPGVRIGNDDLAAVAKAAPGRLIAIASVDPIDLGKSDALAEARRAITQLGMRGLNLDAGFYATPLKADDDRLMPFYELALELGVPAFVMSGPTTPNLADNDPLAVDRVAGRSRSCRSSAATASIRAYARWSPWRSATRTSSSRPTCTRSPPAARSTSRRRMGS